MIAGMETIEMRELVRAIDKVGDNAAKIVWPAAVGVIADAHKAVGRLRETPKYDHAIEIKRILRIIPEDLPLDKSPKYLAGQLQVRELAKLAMVAASAVADKLIEQVDCPEIMSAQEFIDGYEPPNYLIDGIIQRNRLYSCTALTGHGKTAVWLTIAAYMASGFVDPSLHVKPGHVLYLAAENPDDVRGRLILLANKFGLDLPKLRMNFIEKPFSLQAAIPDMHRRIDAQGHVDLVVVDTSVAFLAASGAAEENSNLGMLNFAYMLRSLTELPGEPAVVALGHPTKNATRDNLLPRGGSAFLNEVDGNLTLYADEERKTTELSWTGKFRGVNFAPVTFALETGTCDALVDHAGRRIPSVWASPTSAERTEQAATSARSDEDQVLVAMLLNPHGSCASPRSRLDDAHRSRKVSSGARHQASRQGRPRRTGARHLGTQQERQGRSPETSRPERRFEAQWKQTTLRE